MRAMACVSESDCANIRLLAPRVGFVRIADREALTRAIRSMGFELLLCDPAKLRSDYFEAIVHETQWSSLALTFYTEIDDLVASRIIDSVGYGLAEVIVRGVELRLGLFERTLMRAMDGSAAIHLLKLIAPRIIRMRARLRTAVVATICDRANPTISTVAQLAERARMPRRSVDREIARADLGSAAHFLSAIRVAKAWQERRSVLGGAPSDQTHSVFESRRTATNHFQRILAMTPRESTNALSYEQVAERAQTFLNRV